MLFMEINTLQEISFFLIILDCLVHIMPKIFIMLVIGQQIV